jgi:CHAT domain-containing protein
MAAGLKLADRWLTVRDLYGLSLDGALVVLSGCDTGRAAIGGGDDLVGLIRGFFAAGASGLLMTMWALHDDSAAKTMARIYEMWQNAELEGRPGLSAAVCGAQRRMMEELPHPIFWAPFILVGRP